jgi:hypothetical protein
MFKRFYRNRYGYSRWDGTQNIEGLDADDVLDALSDDYIEDGDLQQALRRLMQNGVPSNDGQRTLGLRDLMERLRNQRNQQLNRYNMASGVMDDLREKLEEIKKLEREGIQRRLDDAQNPSQENQPRQPGQQGQDGQDGQEGQPSDQRSTTSSTAMRLPFIMGLPTSILGSMPMRSCHVITTQDNRHWVQGVRPSAACAAPQRSKYWSDAGKS